MPIMPSQTSTPSAANLGKLPIEKAQEAENTLKGVHPIVNPMAPKSQQRNDLLGLKGKLNEVKPIVNKDEEDVDRMLSEVNETGNMQSNTLASSYFNLKKYSQDMMGGPPMEDPNMPTGMPLENNGIEDPMAPSMEEGSQGLNFSSAEELYGWLEQNAGDPEAMNQLISSIPQDSQFQSDEGFDSDIRNFVRDSLERFSRPESDSGEKMMLAGEIFEKLFGQEEEPVEGVYTSPEAESLVASSDLEIQKFAKKIASTKSQVKKAKSYNLKKEAQYRGSPEFINFGPESRRMLPYGNTGVVGSDWHVWERAKGHNFIMDDVAIDFETFWRGNIMDKYSRPYRNNKGEWVGGYMNKRFEVDRNIPEGNNYQLLPGQLRRPILPEFGNMEARLTAARKDMAERGYDPTSSEDKAYNWKEASSSVGLKKK